MQSAQKKAGKQPFIRSPIELRSKKSKKLKNSILNKTGRVLAPKESSVSNAPETPSERATEIKRSQTLVNQTREFKVNLYNNERIIESSEEEEEEEFVDTVNSLDHYRIPEEMSKGANNQAPLTMDDLQKTLIAALQAVMDRPTQAASINNQNQPRNESFNFGEAGKTIPIFDPISVPNQTVVQWLKKVDELAGVYGWSEKATIHYAMSKLEGVAKTWYDGLDSIQHTWAEWKKELKKWFPAPKGTQKLFKDMEERLRRREEPLEVYYHEKLKMAKACGLDEDTIMEYIITGINDDRLVTALSNRSFDDLPELLQVMKQLEDRLKISREARDKVRSSKAASETQQKTDKFSNEKRSQSNNAPKNSSSNRKPLYNEKGESLCFNCQSYGHMGKDCKQPKKPQCSKCKKYGHETKDCRQASNNNKTTLHVTDNQAEESGNDKYFKEAYINGIATRAYLDMGSKCVTVPESEARRLNLQVTPLDRRFVIGGYGDGKTQPLGKFRASIKLDQATADVEGYVVPDSKQAIPLLVGQPFTEQPHITVVKRLNVIRVFEEQHLSIEEDDCLKNISIPELPKPSVSLWASTAAVIPPNYIGFIQLLSDCEKVEQDIFVDNQIRMKPGNEYLIPRGIYSTGKDRETTMSVMNISEKELAIREGQIMARAQPCEKDRSPTIEILRTETKELDPLPVEDIEVGQSVSEETKSSLYSLLNEFRDCFAINLSELGRTDVATMKIELNDTEPVTYRPYRLSYKERELVRGKIEELLEADIIEESNSPYASPILIVKKNNGDERICIDFRALNRKLKKNAFPLPLIDEQLERLNGCRYFTSLDLMSGYYQIPVDTDSREVTAFVTPDGHYQFKTMPFGLSTAPAVFQRMMNKVLGALRYAFALTYLDDVLLPAADEEESLTQLRQVLEVLRNSNLTLNLKKCKFLKDEVEYLGFEISAEGIRPGSKKIESVRNFPTPTNVHEVRRFIGLASFFRRFVKGFAQEAEPLTNLIRKEQDWCWSQTQQSAFDSLRAKLTERPLLGLYDPMAVTELHTDASQIGLGVILLQQQSDQKMHPISYASRKTTSEESRYHSSELETLALVWGLEKFRAYLIGQQFTIVTDCNSIRSTFAKKHLVPRIGRWWIRIQEFTFVIEHRPGDKMSHVDALSRAPYSDPEETDAPDGISIFHTTINQDDWLVIAQKNDKKIQNIAEIIQKSGKLSKEESRIKDEFAIKNGRVYRKVLGTGKLLWVVPDIARWRIVKSCHDDIGHFGLEKTLGKLRENFWFPRMTRYVRRYLSGCLECLYHKKPAGKRPGMLHSIEKIGTPFHTVHLDHLGPFVKSVSGNTFLIVAIDAFTKFVVMRAVRNTGMHPTCKFFAELIAIFGAPVRVITDRGTAYSGKAFVKLCKDSNIQHILNATATPRGNGQVEIVNKSLTPALATMSQRPDEKDWDQHLPQIAWGINNTLHKATRRSPFSLLLNFESRSPAGNPPTETAVKEIGDENVMKRRQIAIENIRKDQAKQRLRYNAKRAKAPIFEPGDMVLVERQPQATGTSLKTATKYKGPYVVAKKLNYDRYLIEDLPETQRTQKFYRSTAPVDKLKRFLIVDNNEGESTDAEDSQSENEDESVSDHDIGLQEIKTARCRPLKVKNPEIQMVPEIKAKVPNVNPEVPNVNPDVPKVNPDVPKVNPDVPKVNPDVPKVNPDIPKVNQCLKNNPRAQRTKKVPFHLKDYEL